MAGRRLNAEERALWQRVTETVRALDPSRAVPPPAPAVPENAVQKRARNAPAPAAPAPDRAKPTPPRPAIANTLDGSWDRRIGRGSVMPDYTVDLHGHSLDSAYRVLDTSLANAIAMGARVVLLITGKPPRSDARGMRPMRGAIRAAVGDWLAMSRHARHIAAVRNAHPRHGGTGALYIVLRRDRTAT